MSTTSRFIALLIALSAVSVTDFPLASVVHGQDAPALFESAGPAQAAHPKGRLQPRRARRARARLAALDAPAVTFNLFDGTTLLIRKVKADRPRPGRLVWHGRSEDGAIATVTVVNDVMTATVFREFETFEATVDTDGTYTIREIEPASFPTDDPPFDEMPVVGDAAGAGAAGAAAAVAADGATEIDVMVVWTPAARNAVGGTEDAIESLVLSSVANANLSYANSLVNARLRLVYAGEVAYSEGLSGISGDLSALGSPNDGLVDQVHTMRNQHGADIVTLIGSGYVASGACGIGFRMTMPSTSFASSAFNVVDWQCAAGYLSYAHEVGHNQGLHHDPSNASGSAAIYPYAYGYQDPSGAFRTVLSYGGATRIPYLSNPLVSYNGAVTGTATQDNARALNLAASIVSAFRPTAGTPTCTYTVSPTALSFSESTGSATVSVTTSPGCAWSASSQASWASVSSGGSGSGSVAVTVSANSTAARSTSLTVAGRTVTVSQAAAPVCSYNVTPTSLSFGATSGAAVVSVTTAAGCAWSVSSGSSWASVSGSGIGAGSASVTVSTNGAGSRSASLTVAGRTVTVTQAAAAPVCTFTVSPTSLSVSANSSTALLTVTTQSGCAWSSSSTVSWAPVSGSGTGSGTATVSVAANTSGARNARVTVAGRAVDVSQAGASRGKGTPKK